MARLVYRVVNRSGYCEHCDREFEIQGKIDQEARFARLHPPALKKSILFTKGRPVASRANIGKVLSSSGTGKPKEANGENVDGIDFTLHSETIAREFGK